MGRAAVTGATGFIGSAVVRQLLEQGRDVRCLVEPGADTRNLDGLDVEILPADVCDFAAMRAGLEGCDTLFHLAALYKIWLPDDEPMYRINVEGTTTTLLAAQAAKVRRVVYTSSVAAIGLVDGGLADETTRFDLFPIANPYILSKWQSERVALRFAESGLPVVVVNPGFPFGPRDIAPTPTGGIVRALLEGKVPGRGAGGFCTIDVDDCARGHLLAEERGRVGERYILGGENITASDFFDLVCRVAGVRAPRVHFPAPLARAAGLAMELWADHVSHEAPFATYRGLRYAQREAFFSNAKAKRELGLTIRPLEETVRRSVAWFQSEAKGERAIPRASGIAPA